MQLFPCAETILPRWSHALRENKQSGLGREGVTYAMEEMTNIKMVCINL